MGTKAFKGLLRWLCVASSLALLTLMAAGSVSAQPGVSFLPRVDYAVGMNPRSVAVGDFNGDGIVDLAVANLNQFLPSNNVSVLLGNGDGTFQAAVNFGAASNARSVAVGDFNDNGKPDLPVANFSSRNVSILLNTTP